MAGNLQTLQMVQVGTESTWGTAVTPTAKLTGVEAIAIESTGSARMGSAELRGSLVPAYTAARGQVSGKGSASGFLTYEDINYWLESLCGTVTPTGAGPYVRAGAAPLTSIVANRKLTFVVGQGTDVYKLSGGIVSKLVISGKTGEEVKFSAEMIGKDKSTGTLAALTDRAVTVMDGSVTSVYIDAWGGTLGATQISALATNFELTLDAGSAVRNYLGALTPARYRQGRWQANSNTLKLSLEFDATSKAYLDDFLTYTAVTQHQVRLKTTTGANYIAQFDFCGTLTQEPKQSFDDGVLMLDLTYSGTYHTTVANWFKYSITNQLSTLP